LETISGFDPAMTRRIAQDPRVRERIIKAIYPATCQIHRRRVRQWAAADEGLFPTWAESSRLATAEIATLCRALGTLAALSPHDLDLADAAMADRPAL
jgi:hypothetical protein